MEMRFAEYLHSLEEFEFESSISLFLKQLDDSSFRLLTTSIDDERLRRRKRDSTVEQLDSDTQVNAKKIKSTSEPPTSTANDATKHTVTKNELAKPLTEQEEMELMFNSDRCCWCFRW